MNLRTVGVGIFCLFLMGGTFLLVLQPEPAEAGYTNASVSDLTEFIGDSQAALNLRLMALDALRKKTDKGIEGELEDLAEGGDFQIAVYATTALGKKKTSDAKTKLKNLLTSTTLDSDIRKSAMTAIAVHFKDKDDLTYLKSQTASDSKLKAHASWLETYIYGGK